jgi:hypothetical protein
MTARLSDVELGERLPGCKHEANLVPLKSATGAAFNHCHESAEVYARTCYGTLIEPSTLKSWYVNRRSSSLQMPVWSTHEMM